MASVDSALLPLAPKQPEISIDFWPCWSLSSWGKAASDVLIPHLSAIFAPTTEICCRKNKRNAVTAIQQMLLWLRFAVQSTAGCRGCAIDCRVLGCLTFLKGIRVLPKLRLTAVRSQSVRWGMKTERKDDVGSNKKKFLKVYMKSYDVV